MAVISLDLPRCLLAHRNYRGIFLFLILVVGIICCASEFSVGVIYSDPDFTVIKLLNTELRYLINM